MKKKKTPEMPSTQQLEAELNRVKYRSRYRSVFRSTVYTLITVAAVSILVATLWLPVLQIYGSSMTPPRFRMARLFSPSKHQNLNQERLLHFTITTRFW